MSNTPPQLSTESETVRIDVDAERALAVLSGSVFAGVEESIRELLTNAADSLEQLPQHARRAPEIRLSVDSELGILSVSDNGVGMTRGEAREFLGKLFCSSKKSRAGVIGQFGVGFYSCFRLCSRVEVLTCSHSQEDLGTRMTYCGGDTMELSSIVLRIPGTTVRLYLLDGHRDLLQVSVLRRLVRRYCNFIQYPIYLGADADLANEMHAPWERTRADEIVSELIRVLEIPSPLAVFPLEAASCTMDEPLVAGVLFVTETSPVPPVRLYVARVLITEDDETLLPPEFRAFVSAVLNIDGVPLVLSRDGLVAESIEVECVRERLTSQLGQGLVRLARERRQDFALIQRAHGVALKEACFKHEELRSELCGHLLFRSSQQAQTTLPEYLKRSREPVVIYADDVTAAEALLPLYHRANVEVLYMTDAVDRRLREVWPKDHKRFEFRRVDAAPPSKDRLPSEHAKKQASATVIEQAHLLFRGQIPDGIRMETKPLGASGPAAILAIDEEARHMIEAALVVREMKSTGRLNELPMEMREIASTGMIEFMADLAPRTLILNSEHPLIRHLFNLLAAPSSSLVTKKGKGSVSHWFQAASAQTLKPLDLGDVPPLLARFLYDQAMLGSGLPLPRDDRNAITQSQTMLISTLLSHLQPET